MFELVWFVHNRNGGRPKNTSSYKTVDLCAVSDITFTVLSSLFLVGYDRQLIGKMQFTIHPLGSVLIAKIMQDTVPLWCLSKVVGLGMW